MIEQACFSDVLLEGAREVFETMMFMDLEENPDSVIGAGETFLSSITFTGELEGCLGFSAGIESARNIAANMLGLDPEEETNQSEITDALGEVTNMIMGSFKSRVAEKGNDISVSIPSVVKGQELCNSLGEGAQEVSITADLDYFPIKLMLVYRNRKHG